MDKLFYTPNSPYSRIARVVALVLKTPIEFVEVTVRESADELLSYNPAAKVPSLELKNGIVLSETRLICEYFESLSKRTIIARVDDHVGRHWEGVFGGFLDGIAVWVREVRRPIDEQSPSIITLEKTRCMRCLSYFEETYDFDLDMKFAPIILVSAIELMHKRLPLEWRLQHRKVSDWYDAYSELAEMKQTAPKN